jgi:hypothetical protein
MVKLAQWCHTATTHEPLSTQCSWTHAGQCEPQLTSRSVGSQEQWRHQVARNPQGAWGVHKERCLSLVPGDWAGSGSSFASSLGTRKVTSGRRSTPVGSARHSTWAALQKAPFPTIEKKSHQTIRYSKEKQNHLTTQKLTQIQRQSTTKCVKALKSKQYHIKYRENREIASVHTHK